MTHLLLFWVGFFEVGLPKKTQWVFWVRARVSEPWLFWFGSTSCWCDGV